uniref:Uncharacterized protein n=1 Tax=uncultured bacterium A1Q1_fos_2111 TaxID=1256563 RepID=L7VYY5_9BACT|nr:hypothetical protein [uncultured bacterium A1Q1_fos_2111]
MNGGEGWVGIFDHGLSLTCLCIVDVKIMAVGQLAERLQNKIRLLRY